MSAVQQRWFAAILLRYNLRDPFWDRDAGVLYSGLRGNGIDAKFCAIGNPSAHAEKDLVLGSLEELATAAWWRQWKLNGVILYSWALPQFTPVVTAIKSAGIRVVLVLDTAGYISPRVDLKEFLRLKMIGERARHRFLFPFTALAKTFGGMPRNRSAGLLEHLEKADFFIIPSTLGVQRYSRFLTDIGRPDLAARARLVPHPVSEKMYYDSSVAKQKLIIAVGGWNRYPKNAPALVSTLQRVLAMEPGYNALVVGPGAGVVERLASGWPAELKSRIRITGPVPNAQLPAYYQKSRISFCPSRSESFHIATAEALCCGCSFVGDARLSPMPYFASLGCGTLSCDGSTEGFSDAILAEMTLWDSGLRNPEQISRTWISQLHPEKVVERILGLR